MSVKTETNKLDISAKGMKVMAKLLATQKTASLDEITLNQIGMPEELRENLLSARGLVLIGGTTGNGKTTSCTAMINERLKRHFGVRDMDVTGELSHLFSGGTKEGDDVRLFWCGDLRSAGDLECAINLSRHADTVLGCVHGGGVVEVLLRAARIVKNEEDFISRLGLVIHQELKRDQEEIYVKWSYARITESSRETLLANPKSEWKNLLADEMRTSAWVKTPLNNFAHSVINAGLDADNRGRTPASEAAVARLSEALKNFPKETHTQRLEMVSKACGFRGWHAAEAHARSR